MASLRKIALPSGAQRWELRWRDHRLGAERRRRYQTRELANRALQRALEQEWFDPDMPPDRRATVADLIDLEEAKSSRTDNKTRRSYINNHVPKSLLRMNARSVAIEDIEAVLKVAANTLSKESVKKLRNILSSVFTFGVQRRYCNVNPVTGARIPATCHPSRRVRKMTDSEIDPTEIPSPKEVVLIADAVEPRYRLAVMLMGLVGLRLGEVAGLAVSHWNPEIGCLRVHRSSPHTDQIKGRRTFRDVYVPKCIAEIIEKHIGDYGIGEDGPLIPTATGRWLDPHNFRSRNFYPAVDRALGQEALDEEGKRRIRPHDLRHTAASLLIAAGVNDIEVAYQLGHTNAAFTRRVYAGVWRFEERQVSAKLEAAMPAEPGDPHSPDSDS